MKPSTDEDLRAEYLRLYDRAAPGLRTHLVQVVRAVCGDPDEDTDRGDHPGSPPRRRRIASVPQRAKRRSP
jgi:hypothetical protein